jgi:hypothetical protein
MKADGTMENIWKEGVKSFEMFWKSYLSNAD